MVKPISILVVDDNLDTARSYAKALMRKIKVKDAEYIDVNCVDDVLTAVNLLSSQRYEILVVDLKIPGFSGDEWGGLELIDECKKLDQLQQVIAISGYGTVELFRKTNKQGVFDFIEKSTTAIDDLIQAVQKALDNRYEKIIRSGNPFTPMTGIDPTFFGGRTEELEFFEQKLYRAIEVNRCEHFLIFGEWGIGKSSLLKEFRRMCHNRGYKAAIVTLEPFSPEAKPIEVARSIVEGILRDLPYQTSRFKQVINFFESIGITVLGTGLQFKRNLTTQEISVQAFLHDSLLNLWQDIEKETDVFVILIDDLENFSATPEILMTLKSTLSMNSLMQTRILIGLASTTGGWLTFTSDEKHHPLSRYFLSRIKLKALSQIELRDTVIGSLRNTGVSFSSEVIERIFDYTQGHPFEMQSLCSHLFSKQISGRVDVDVWDKALEETIEDMSLVYERWLDQCSQQELNILKLLANSEQPLLVEDIQHQLEIKHLKNPVVPLEKSIRTLLERKLFQRKESGMYLLNDFLFTVYIKNKIDSYS